jgi:uncharacterized protein (TIGR00369 family)
MKQVNNDNGCFICGEDNPYGFQLKPILDRAAQCATLELQIPQRFQGWQGLAHGGILAALLDEVSVHACMSENTQFVTAGINIRYLKPVPVEQPIRVVAKVCTVKRRKLTVAAELYSAGVLCATAETQVMALTGAL